MGNIEDLKNNETIAYRRNFFEEHIKVFLPEGGRIEFQTQFGEKYYVDYFAENKYRLQRLTERKLPIFGLSRPLNQTWNTLLFLDDADIWNDIQMILSLSSKFKEQSEDKNVNTYRFIDKDAIYIFDKHKHDHISISISPNVSDIPNLVEDKIKLEQTFKEFLKDNTNVELELSLYLGGINYLLSFEEVALTNIISFVLTSTLISEKRRSYLIDYLYSLQSVRSASEKFMTSNGKELIKIIKDETNIDDYKIKLGPLGIEVVYNNMEMSEAGASLIYINGRDIQYCLIYYPNNYEPTKFHERMHVIFDVFTMKMQGRDRFEDVYNNLVITEILAITSTIFSVGGSRNIFDTLMPGGFHSSYYGLDNIDADQRKKINTVVTAFSSIIDELLDRLISKDKEYMQKLAWIICSYLMGSNIDNLVEDFRKLYDFLIQFKYIHKYKNVTKETNEKQYIPIQTLYSNVDEVYSFLSEVYPESLELVNNSLEVVFVSSKLDHKGLKASLNIESNYHLAVWIYKIGSAVNSLSEKASYETLLNLQLFKKYVELYNSLQKDNDSSIENLDLGVSNDGIIIKDVLLLLSNMRIETTDNYDLILEIVKTYKSEILDIENTDTLVKLELNHISFEGVVLISTIYNLLDIESITKPISNFIFKVNSEEILSENVIVSAFKGDTDAIKKLKDLVYKLRLLDILRDNRDEVKSIDSSKYTFLRDKDIINEIVTNEVVELYYKIYSQYQYHGDLHIENLDDLASILESMGYRF